MGLEPCTICWKNFLEAGMIRETKAEGRKRSYVITEAGKKALWDEQQRLLTPDIGL